MNETLIRLKLSFFLGLRSLQRGSIGSLVMTIVIIGMVFTNMIFLPSVITGAINLFVDQTIEFQSGDILIEPRENAELIEDLEDHLAVLLGQLLPDLLGELQALDILCQIVQAPQETERIF